jgi:signal transduction histidine kinase
LKYGVPDAGPGPEVRLTGEALGHEVRITVADNGPGIAPPDRERAVERFIRLDESRTRPGSGLGLALVQAVARLHGGRLDLADAHPGLAATLVLPRGGEGKAGRSSLPSGENPPAARERSMYPSA